MGRRGAITDLRGFGPYGTPRQMSEVVSGFLHSLGVPAERIPAGDNDRAALFRGLLADHQVLVVLKLTEWILPALVPCG